MSSQTKIKAISLTTFNSASLTTSYQAINSNGLNEACSILRIYNDASTAITISYDGVTDHEYLGDNDSIQIDAQTNSEPASYLCNFPKGLIVYVKGTAGTGTIALSGYYQS